MPLATAKYHLCPWKNRRPNDSTATASWFLVALLLAPLGTRGARWLLPPAGSQNQKGTPPPCSFVAQIVYRCTTPVLAAVSSTLEPMSKAAASLVRGLVAIVRSRWHLAVVAQTACRPVDQSLRRSWFCSALRRSVRLWSRCYHSVRDASWARRGVRARQCSGACCLGAARARAWGPSCCCSLIPSPYSGYRTQ